MRIEQVDEKWIVPIARIGALASWSVGQGRMIPVLIIDCRDRQDLRDVIVHHEHVPSGDVRVNWGTPRFQNRMTFLHVKFERPAVLNALFKFDIRTQGHVVDSIIHARGLYLQPLEFGASVSEGLDNSKITVEIPPIADYIPIWNEMFYAQIEKRFREGGMNRQEAKQARIQYVSRLREIWQIRMKPER